MRNNKKMSSGITLIALVVTIIVLLILAGISIAMLSGNNGILQRATDAKKLTGEANVIEQAQIDIFGQISENKGEGLTETQLKTILSKYFEEFDDELPEDLSETDITLTAKETYGSYTNIELAKIYNGKLRKESTPTDIYVAQYNDGTLVFSNNRDDIDSDKLKTTIVQVDYDEWGNVNYSSEFYGEEISKVIILNKIVPINCSYWFFDYYNLEEILNIENIDTSLVTNMSNMFGTCERLTVDLSSFNTSNVTDMSYMFANTMFDDFSGASNVIGWQNFDVGNVTNMQGMFYDVDFRSSNGEFGEKIENLLDLCIRATKISSNNKTLNYLGLPATGRVWNCPASSIEPLSNYQDFLNAGWTIGY